MKSKSIRVLGQLFADLANYVIVFHAVEDPIIAVIRALYKDSTIITPITNIMYLDHMPQR